MANREAQAHTAYIQTAHLNSYYKKTFCLLKVQCAHTLICCFICSLEFAHFINTSLQKPTCVQMGDACMQK